MEIKTEALSTNKLEGKPAGHLVQTEVLTGEVGGVCTELFSMRGAYQLHELPQPGFYDILWSLDGRGMLNTAGERVKMGPSYIARIPYKKAYRIHVAEGEEFHFLRIRKTLDDHDTRLIATHKKEHETLYVRALSDCPEYSEDIKSDKTVNRMLLPEGMVPRFCMGSVETRGPDEVAAHDHPMLDQLFFGLPGCHCTCHADHDHALLSENILLHIPMGSTHAVSVSEGKTLAYIWFDFFLTLEGQKYMNEQHHLDEE